MKTPVPESLFNKVVGLRPATLLKKRLAQLFSCKFCEISKNTFFHRTPLVVASVDLPVRQNYQEMKLKYKKEDTLLVSEGEKLMEKG